MSASQRRYFSGDTLRQALVQAANHFNLDPDEIAYRAIEKRHGFIKNRKKVLIEVDAEAPRRTAPPPPIPAPPGITAPRPAAPPPPPPAPAAAPRPAEPRAFEERPPVPRPERERRPSEPERRERRDWRDRREARPSEEARLSRAEVRPATPPAHDEEDLVVLPERPRSASERYPAAAGPLAEAAQKGLALLLSIAGLDLAPKILQGEEGRLEVELSGSDTDRCFEEEGEVLRSIEHLLPRVIRALCGETLPVRVDCDNFHEIREEQLRTLAQRVAAEVRRRGRPRTLEPMNPADRRVIHMTLADDPGVMTESEGEGYFKRVSIRPV